MSEWRGQLLNLAAPPFESQHLHLICEPTFWSLCFLISQLERNAFFSSFERCLVRSQENNESTAPRVQGVLNKCDLLMKHNTFTLPSLLLVYISLVI